LVRVAMSSVADTAVVPLQDVLGLGSESRMNLPGRAQGNWAWRMRQGELSTAHADWLRGLAETYERTAVSAPA